MVNELTESERIAAERAENRAKMRSVFLEGLLDITKLVGIVVAVVVAGLLVIAAILAFVAGLFVLFALIFKACDRTVWGAIVAGLATLLIGGGLIVLFITAKRMIICFLYQHDFINEKTRILLTCT